MKERYTIEKDGFVGYWHPAKGHDGKALIVFPGSGAGYELTRKGSEFFEKAGWNRLLVAFAGWDGLPEDPVLAPVEYAEKAIAVLKDAGFEKIGVYGISAGAKFAITAASLLPDISLVIAASPFDYTTEAFKGTKALNESTFSYRGEPLPYDPTVTLHRNIISVLFRTAFSKKYGMRRMLRGCYEENVSDGGSGNGGGYEAVSERFGKHEQRGGGIYTRHPCGQDLWANRIFLSSVQEIY